MTAVKVRAPILNGVYTYEYRNTGDAWSDPIVVIDGVADPTKNFVAPTCDELRFTAVFPTPRDFDAVMIENSSITSGLSFQVDTALAPAAVAFVATQAQITDAKPRPFAGNLIEFPQQSVDTITFTITGIGQTPFQFEQLSFCADMFQPAIGYLGEAERIQARRYTVQRTRTMNQQRLDDASRQYVLPFLMLTSDELEDLEYLVDVLAVDGFVMVDLEPDSTKTRTKFLASASVSPFKQQNVNLEAAELNVLETYPK